MKRFDLRSALGVFALVTTLLNPTWSSAATSSPKGAVARLVPIQEFVAGRREQKGHQISPDGKRIAWLSFDGEKSAIAIKQVGNASVVFINAAFGNFKWATDSRHLLLSLDQPGGESRDLYVADTANPAAPLRNLTQLKNGWASFVQRSTSSPTAIFLEHSERSLKAYDLYLVDVLDGKQKLIAKNPGNITQWLVDDDVVRAHIEQADSTRSLVLRSAEVNTANAPVPRRVATWTVADALIPIGFDLSGKSLWVATDKDEDRIVLKKIHLADGSTQTVYASPRADIDFEENLPTVGPKSKHPILAVSEPDYPRVHFFNKAMRKALSPLMVAGPVRIGLLSIDDAEAMGIVKVFDGKGTKHYLVDLRSGKLELLAKDFFSRHPEVVAATKPIKFLSRDGQMLHGYLTKPIGVPSGINLATVVRVHGGPWFRNIWGNTDLAAAASQVQFLANRGYAVLEVNFRGSTGYGKKFKFAGAREFGKKMQDDIVDGVRWSIAQGIADPSRIAIMGTSYGGYSALMGMSASPQPFACGIAAAAPTDLAKLIESNTEAWAFDMHIWHRFVGDPNIATDRAAMLAVSPINRIASIEKPLLLIYGVDDPVVRFSQATAYVDELKRTRKAFTFLPLSGEGHAIVGLTSQVEMYKKIEGFLASCVGGRTK